MYLCGNCSPNSKFKKGFKNNGTNFFYKAVPRRRECKSQIGLLCHLQFWWKWLKKKSFVLFSEIFLSGTEKTLNNFCHRKSDGFIFDRFFSIVRLWDRPYEIFSRHHFSFFHKNHLNFQFSIYSDNRDRKGPIVNFVQLCLRFKSKRKGKEDYVCDS